VVTNFDSPPDTAFGVHGVATAAAIGRRHGRPELAELLRPFLVKAGQGMAQGGVHTLLPGWVLGAAAVPRVAGLPFLSTIEETFALFLEDYWHTPLNGCANDTPVDWVAVHVRLDLVRH